MGKEEVLGDGKPFLGLDFNFEVHVSDRLMHLRASIENLGSIEDESFE